MLINYQAKLIDDSNEPISGSVSITFRLYNAIENGTLLWTENHGSIESSDGLISVLLGSVESFDHSVFSGSSLFLETEVSGFGILSPRQQLTSVPFAIKAENTHKLFLSGYTNSFQGTSNSDEFTVLDTVFDAGSFKEYIRIEIKETADYGNYEGYDCRVRVGISGQALTNYGDIGIQNKPYFRNSPGDMFFNHNPQAYWTVPVTSEMAVEQLQIQIKALDANVNSNYYPVGMPIITIWGK